MASTTHIPLITLTTTVADRSYFSFTNIPQTYKDLIIVISGTVSNSSNNQIVFNSGSSYAYNTIYTSGQQNILSQSSASNTSTQIGILTSGGPSTCIVNIMDYSSTDKFKAVIAQNGGIGQIGFGSGVWKSTSAISTIQLYTSALSIGAVISMYGVDG